MEDKTRKQKGNVSVHLKINNVPVRMALEFSEIAKTYYNDAYWALLMDLMRKAQAYDLMVGSMNPGEEYVAHEEERKEKEEPATLGSARSE